MKQSENNNTFAKRVAWWQSFGVLLMAMISWINEILDIPYVLLGGPSTPINWRESLFESITIAIIGGVIVRYTYKRILRLNYLENILPACSSCKQVRIDPEFWQSVERFVKERSKNEFTHGICPDCIEKYYPELIRQERPRPPKIPVDIL